MNANSKEWLDALSAKVIGCAFNVSNSLGCGFLEKVYENALAVEFRYTGIAYSQQASFLIRHRQEVVGDYVSDLLVENCLVVEVKALDALNRVHQAQCMNYLKASGMRLGLLLNFGRPRVEVQRVVMKF
jgi:GxxExxY protein